MIRLTTYHHRAQALARTTALVAGLTLVALTPMAHAANTSYTVVQGDTVYSIAQRLNLDVDTLRAANRLDANATIKVGQTLVIPGEASRAPSVNLAEWQAEYAVKAGDSLARIAEAHAVSAEKLAAANELEPNAVLQIGQKLRVPTATAPAAAKAALGPAAAPTLAPATGPAATSGPAPQAAPEPTAEAAAPAAPAVPRMAAAPGEPDPIALRVLDKAVVLRSAPSVEAKRLGSAAPNSKLVPVGKDGQWWQVLIPGSRQVAYVAGWVVKRVLPGEPEPPEVVVPNPATVQVAEREDSDRPAAQASLTASIADSRVNLRSGPSVSSTSLTVLSSGTRLSVLQNGAEWVQVRVGNQTGWVSKALTTLATPAQNAASSGSGSGSSIVELAKGYLGVPYRRGGTSRKGVDCSGLVFAIAKQLGKSLPRTAAGMWGTGTKVTRGNLQPGDIVFFKNTYREGISHVGIYTGDGKFIHAARSGRPVAYNSLDEKYYRAHWAGAYRIMD